MARLLEKVVRLENLTVAQFIAKFDVDVKTSAELAVTGVDSTPNKAYLIKGADGYIRIVSDAAGKFAKPYFPAVEQVAIPEYTFEAGALTYENDTATVKLSLKKDGQIVGQEISLDLTSLVNDKGILVNAAIDQNVIVIKEEVAKGTEAAVQEGDKWVKEHRIDLSAVASKFKTELTAASGALFNNVDNANATGVAKLTVTADGTVTDLYVSKIGQTGKLADATDYEAVVNAIKADSLTPEQKALLAKLLEAPTGVQDSKYYLEMVKLVDENLAGIGAWDN